MTAVPATGEPDIPARGGPDVPIINPITMELDEYPSPAFMKRARLSYGALFEDPEDKFDDDGGVKGKGRKRTRFGRDSSSWRYTSQSPSPSPDAEPKTPPPATETTVEVDIKKPSPGKPQMADEGCQTVDLDAEPAQPTQLAADVPSGTEPRDEQDQASSDKDVSVRSPGPSATQLPVTGHENDLPRGSPAQKFAESEKPPGTPKAALPSNRFGSSTLFGSYSPGHSSYDQPRFGNTPRAETGSALGIANQVRFGFSHTPQMDYPQQQPQQLSHTAPAPHRAGQDYPESHLQPSDPSKYADMESYVDQAEQEMEAEPQYGYDGQENPPVSESFAGGQFDIATQAQGYNPIEGGHFGADALDEGTRITTDGYSIHNDEIDVDKVPPGFASFGGGLENQVEEDEIDEDEDEDEDEDQPHIPGEDFVENDEVEDDLDDEVALEDRDMTEYGPEGEILEQGDYDQRVYNIPEEDQDELSEEEHQNELQAMAQDNDPDLVDEDELHDDRMDDNEDYDEGDEGSDEAEDEQGSYDEEEEGLDEEEDGQGSFDDEEDSSSEESDSHGAGAFQDNSFQRWAQPGAASSPQPSVPVIIDLLSSDDDEDDVPAKQPAPKMAKPAILSATEPLTTVESVSATFASVPSEPPAKQDQTPTRQNLSAGDQHDAVLEPSPGPELRVAAQEQGRRKSSGSHLYGENVEEPVDDAKMDLHLPSTPPPDAQQSANANTDTQDKRSSPADAEHDVPVAEDNFNAGSSIPSFNGALESGPVSDTATNPQDGSSNERGETGPSENPSLVQSSAFQEQENENTLAPELGDDGGLSAERAHASEGQNVTGVVTKPVSSPPHSVGDADATEAAAESADVSKRDVAEVERLFEEMDAPGEDTVMAEEGNGDEELPHDASDDIAPPDEQAVHARSRAGSPGSQKQDRGKESYDRDAISQMPSSPVPHSPSFASQVFTSSPVRTEGDTAYLPTTMESQPSQLFIPSQSLISDTPADAALALLPEAADAADSATTTTVATHTHIQQQLSVVLDPDADGNAEADIEMTDALADDDATSVVEAQSFAPADELEDEDAVDTEVQIQTQLQYELMSTSVQTSGDAVTIVQKTRRVSVLQPDSTAPVETASLEEAIQEELMLQDQVDQEMASQVGDDDETALALDVADADIYADVDEEEDMEDEEAEEEPVVVDDSSEDDNGEPETEDAGAQEALAAIEAHTGEETDEQDADAQLQREDTVKPNIPAVAEEPVPHQEATIPVDSGEGHEEPGEGDEEVILIGEGHVPGQEEGKDTQEDPLNATPPKPKEDSEVLIGRQTRSRRARDQPPQSEAATHREDVSAAETTKEASPEANRVTKRGVGGTKRSTRSKEAQDTSVELAKASLQKRGAGNRKVEEASVEPRRTRQRSASARPVVPSGAEGDEDAEEDGDNSIALAQAILESPSRKHSEPAASNPAALRADLLKRLRSTLAEFMPLKALRHHKKGHPHVLAVVACDPPEPQRTKHRDYHTTVTVTDPSVAPDQVVEVRFMEQHKVYLPAVRQGDTLVLRNFEIVSLSDKQFALKQLDEESSWAVFDADYEVPGGRGGQVFELQEAVRDYLHDLRVWYNDIDVVDREKLVTAVTKLAEVEGSSG
jgi:hypothetical protein